MIKLFKPYVDWRAPFYVAKVLFSGQLAEGPVVKRFEDEFSKKFNKKNVVAVNSGTSALELCYDLAGLEPGDEVITPVLTCTATNLPLARRRVKIVFADVNYQLNIDIEDVKRKITNKTRAVVFVHFGGNNYGLKELKRLCKERGVILIEDAAQAVGSDYWGVGDYTAVSLQAIKTLTTGDGGIVITKRKRDAVAAKRLRWFGYDRELKQKKGDTDLKEAGYKFHMNDISAAIGLANLKGIDKVIAHRKKLEKRYKDAGFVGGLWMMSKLTKDALQLKNELLRAGYQAGQHHYRNDKYTVFGGRQKFVIMDQLEDVILHVPIHHKVSLGDVEEIIQICKKT